MSESQREVREGGRGEIRVRVTQDGPKMYRVIKR